MAALNTDKFKKVSRRWVGQVGAGGVADASITTVPLASSTNLATDTAVVVVIDRVDANGTVTASLEETIIGIVSGSSLVSCVRGAEGTAQAHSAGAVVEVLVTAKGLNDLIDGLLVQHNQLGLHTNITACNVTASGTTTASHITASDITSRFITACDIELNGVDVISLTASQTLTNKRITKRVSTEVSNATPTINTDNSDMHTITALAAAITSFTSSLSGTPTSGQTLIIRIKDDGTARTITWGASFASRGATLPATTTLSKVTYVGLIWNSTASIWDCIAAVTEA